MSASLSRFAMLGIAASDIAREYGITALPAASWLCQRSPPTAR